jgi:hypothetical protein
MTTLIVYVVQEWQTDYDDYPIGPKRTLYATADLERAKRDTDWRLPLRPKTVRGYMTIEVEDINLDAFLS